MLPSVFGPDESIYPLTADPTTARRWLAKAKFKPTRLVLYASNSTTGTLAAQLFALRDEQDRNRGGHQVLHDR